MISYRCKHHIPCFWVLAMIALNQFQENITFSTALPMSYIPGAAPFFEGRISNSTYGEFNFDKLPIDIWYPVDTSENDTSPIDDIKYLFNLVVEKFDDCDLTLPEDVPVSNFTELPENCTLFQNFTIPNNITELCGMIPEEVCDLIERPPPRNGTFPLIIYSHDDGTLGAESITFLSSLAALGFFVVATNHIGDTGLDNVDVDEVALFNRPRDVSAVIDYMLTDSAFSDSIDETSIGVMGRGHGGFTAYAMAGGYKNFTGDARVGAILSVAGLSTPLTDSEIENITIPLMVIGGTLDTQVPIEDNTDRVWNQSNSKYAYRVDVEGAVHDSFTNVCGLIQAVNITINRLPDNITDSAVGDILFEFQDMLLDRGEGVCSDTAPDEVLDVNIVHTVSLSYITSFFKVILTADEKFEFFLTPLFARAFPVIYERQITTEPPTPVPTVEGTEPPTFNTCKESCADANSRLRCLRPSCAGCSFCVPTMSPTDQPSAFPTTLAPTTSKPPTAIPTNEPTVGPTALPEIWVEKIVVRNRMKGRNKFQPTITLKILSDAGNVRGATVILDWEQDGTIGSTNPKSTTVSGKATIELPKFSINDVVVVSMNSVAKEEFRYNSARNVKYENDCSLFSAECPIITIVKP